MISHHFFVLDMTLPLFCIYISGGDTDALVRMSIFIV